MHTMSHRRARNTPTLLLHCSNGCLTPLTAMYATTLPHHRKAVSQKEQQRIVAVLLVRQQARQLHTFRQLPGQVTSEQLLTLHTSTIHHMSAQSFCVPCVTLSSTVQSSLCVDAPLCTDEKMACTHQLCSGQ